MPAEPAAFTTHAPREYNAVTAQFSVIEEVNMINIEKSVVIDRPVEEVFAFVAEGSNAPRWQDGLEAVEGRTDVIGSEYTEVRKFMGREMRSLMEVTDYQANRRWAARVLKGPVPYEVSVLVEPRDGATRLTTRIDGEPTGFFKVAEGMVRSQLDKAMEEDVQRLKRIMEGA